MRILYVVHQFFPKGYTGTERLVLNLAKQMQRMGHYVEVLTYGIEDDNTGFLNQDGIMYKRYIFQNIPVISIKYLNIDDNINFTIFEDRLRNILNEFITKGKFDIMHVAHSMRIGYAAKIARSLNVPYVLTLTDFWLICPRGIFVTLKGELCYQGGNILKCTKECLGNFSPDHIQKRIKESKDIFQHASYRISATKFLKKLFEINGFSDINIIKFGTDYSNVRPNIKMYFKDSDITIGYLSSLMPHKGAHILLDAFMNADMNNIRLKIYGDYLNQTHYYEQLKKIVNGNKNVKFCGEYKYEKMADIFDGIDLMIVPSIWWENSPLVLLGALAHKVPAIVPNLGGMTEVIENGKNGFTYDAGDVESLVNVIRKIGNNPTILNDIKNNIQCPPRIEEEAFEYEKIYSNLIIDK